MFVKILENDWRHRRDRRRVYGDKPEAHFRGHDFGNKKLPNRLVFREGVIECLVARLNGFAEIDTSFAVTVLQSRSRLECLDGGSPCSLAVQRILTFSIGPLARRHFLSPFRSTWN
jgi:hypothetical protein